MTFNELERVNPKAASLFKHLIKEELTTPFECNVPNLAEVFGVDLESARKVALEEYKSKIPNGNKALVAELFGSNLKKADRFQNAIMNLQAQFCADVLFLCEKMNIDYKSGLEWGIKRFKDMREEFISEVCEIPNYDRKVH